ncbi:MAG: hypothetical protein V1846_02560 [Candidatus Komeilibacteria bacterium]
MKKIVSILLTLACLVSLAACTAKPNDSVSGVSGKDDRVSVNKAYSTLPGYLVVHQLDNNQPGKIIGLSKLYPLGSISQVTIATADKLQTGTSYAVVLHHDNSDLKFIASQDLPAKNKKGQIIMATFKAK